jgi:hypothetical protein
MMELQFGGNIEGEIGALMKRYEALPRYIAKKHLKAAMKRATKPAVPLLKSNTPVGRTKVVKRKIVRGQFKDNVKERGGALRRASTSKSIFKGKNADGRVIAVLGYKYGWESRKAIWLEYGTSRGITPRRMVGKTMDTFKGPATVALVAELRLALERATKEAAAGINPGVGKSGFGPGRR